MNGETPTKQLDAKYSLANFVKGLIRFKTSANAIQSSLHISVLSIWLIAASMKITCVSMNVTFKFGETLEHAAEDHLPHRAVGEEGVLDGHRHDRGEARRAVTGKARATVLADR